MLDDAEVKVLEEGGDSGEEANALDSVDCSLIEEGLDEEATASLPLEAWTHDDRADLGEVLAVDVEGCTANELM